MAEARSSGHQSERHKRHTEQKEGIQATTRLNEEVGRQAGLPWPG